MDINGLNQIKENPGALYALYLGSAPLNNSRRKQNHADYVAEFQKHLFAQAERVFNLRKMDFTWDNIHDIFKKKGTHRTRKGHIPALLAAAYVALLADNLTKNDKNADRRAAKTIETLIQIALLDLQTIEALYEIPNLLKSHHANAAKRRRVEKDLDKIRVAIAAGIRAAPAALLEHFNEDKTDAARERMRRNLKKIRLIGKGSNAPA